MRRTLVIAVVVALACAASTLAGCVRLAGPAMPAPASAGDWPAGVKEAEVYTAVLRRYLGTPAENSFPEHTFTAVYVLDHAFAGAGDPMGSRGPGTPIADSTQRQVEAALAGTADVVFIGRSQHRDREPGQLRAGQERRHPDHARPAEGRRQRGDGGRQRLRRLPRRDVADLRGAQRAGLGLAGDRHYRPGGRRLTDRHRPRVPCRSERIGWPADHRRCRHLR